MKTLAGRLFKIGTLTTTLISLTVLAACQGGGFKAANMAELSRPGNSSEPQENLNQSKLGYDLNGYEFPESQLETNKERESFYNDLTGQAPTHSEDDLAQDAEDQYQSNLKKKPSEELQPEPETQEPEQQQTKKHKPKKQPKKQEQSQEPAPQIPAPKVEPQQPQAPAQPQPPKAQPQQPAPQPQPQQPEAPAKTPSGNFCRDLNVANGKGEADLSDLYNDDSKLATSMPTTELQNLHNEAKKNKFVCILLPIAIRMEEQVFRQRLEILRLKKKETTTPLTAEDKSWLAKTKESYLLKKDATYQELLARVDIIPLPLLLTQAILESGWGRSAATKDLKNLFGLHRGDASQRCKTGYDVRNACVREFDTIGESVSAYIRLLNTGKHYVKFRETRAEMRKQGQAMDSMKLLKSMPGYNENPMQYEDKINEIMNRSNRLAQYKFREEKVLAEPRN